MSSVTRGAGDLNSGQCNTLSTKLSSPRTLHLQSFLEQKDHILPYPFSLYSLPISYIRWLLIDNWLNTVGCSYLSQPSSHQKNKHSHRPGPAATSSLPPSIHGGLSCLFSLSTISSPPPQSSASWVLIAKRGLSVKTSTTTGIYSAGPHSTQGPLVTSVCLSKCPLQLRQGLTLQPRLSGSSSPEWPRTLEFLLHSLLLLWLETWNITLNSSQHFKPPPFCFPSSAIFFWSFFQPPVRLLFNFFPLQTESHQVGFKLGGFLASTSTALGLRACACHHPGSPIHFLDATRIIFPRCKPWHVTAEPSKTFLLKPWCCECGLLGRSHPVSSPFQLHVQASIPPKWGFCHPGTVLGTARWYVPPAPTRNSPTNPLLGTFSSPSLTPFTFNSSFLPLYRDRVLLCIPGWSWTRYVA